MPALNGDDCIVQDEDGGSTSYNFSELAKVTENDGYEEPLADWEKELLGQPKVTFAKGDIVVIDLPEYTSLGRAFRARWQGLRFPATDIFDGFENVELANGVFDSRTDGFDGDFFWASENLRAFDPKRDFQVGDLIEAPRYGLGPFAPAKGIVTRTEDVVAGDVEVDWTEGPPQLVSGGPMGASAETLYLVGTTEIREVRSVEVGPAYSDFGFEAGQEIGSSDVLEDLPMGTVVIVNDDQSSPVIKLEEGFGRINRYADVDEFGRLGEAYDETGGTFRAADSPDCTVMIAYVPIESN